VSGISSIYGTGKATLGIELAHRYFIRLVAIRSIGAHENEGETMDSRTPRYGEELGFAARGLEDDSLLNRNARIRDSSPSHSLNLFWPGAITIVSAYPTSVTSNPG
jgi:hypothetical protein